MICFLCGDECCCKWNGSERKKFGDEEARTIFNAFKKSPLYDAFAKTVKIKKIRKNCITLSSKVFLGNREKGLPERLETPTRCFILPLQQEDN